MSKSNTTEKCNRCQLRKPKSEFWIGLRRSMFCDDCREQMRQERIDGRKVPERKTRKKPSQRNQKVQATVSKVYFAEAVGTGLVKIGVTKRSVESRLKGLRTMCPVELRIIGVLVGERETEMFLHQNFSHLNHHGEWFEFKGELLEYVNSLNLVDAL